MAAPSKAARTYQDAIASSLKPAIAHSEKHETRPSHMTKGENRPGEESLSSMVSKYKDKNHSGTSKKRWELTREQSHVVSTLASYLVENKNYDQATRQKLKSTRQRESIVNS